MTEWPPPTADRWLEMEAELRVWRQTHPAAPLTELEAVVDARRHAARAALTGESIVLLGSQLPFDQVPAILAHFTRGTVGGETVRRLTEAVALYSLTPDLITLGKVVGGGLPLAAYAGRRPIPIRGHVPLGRPHG